MKDKSTWKELEDPRPSRKNHVKLWKIMNKNQKPGKFGHLESFRPQLPHQRHTARWGITMVAPWEECLLPADLGPAVGITPAGDGTKNMCDSNNSNDNDIYVYIHIYIYTYMYIYIYIYV